MDHPIVGPVGASDRGLHRRSGALIAAALLAVLLASAPSPAQERAVEVVGSSLTISDATAALELETAVGATHRFALDRGRIVVDGTPVGRYEEDGAFERGWRRLLREFLTSEPGLRVDAETLLDWEPPDEGVETEDRRAFLGALKRILGEPAGRGETASAAGKAAPDAPPETVTVEGPEGGSVALAPGSVATDLLSRELARLERALSRLGEPGEKAIRRVALVVHDDYQMPRGRRVDGNLALVDGELRLGGEVAGDVLMLDGTLLLEPTARVHGDLLQVGGHLERHGGRVDGEFLSIRTVGEAPEFARHMDELRDEIDRARDQVRDIRDRVRGPGVLRSVFGNLNRAIGGTLGIFTTFLLMGALGVVAVYFVEPRLATASSTLRRSFGRSFGVGLAGEFLFFPVLLVLVVAVVTWLVIPFYLAAVALAILAGYLAAAYAAGRLVSERPLGYEWIENLRTDSPYFYVLAGLALLLLPFFLTEALHLFGDWFEFLRGLLYFLAVLATWVLLTAGLGAVLLSRGGSRPGYPAGSPGTRPPGGGAASPGPVTRSPADGVDEARRDATDETGGDDGDEGTSEPDDAEPSTGRGSGDAGAEQDR